MDPDGSVAEFRLLGPLEVRARGRIVVLGSPKLRILLAALLLAEGRQVPIAELVEAIWPGRQPDNPRRALQLCVTRLRTVLAAAGAGRVVETCAGGYRVDVPPEQVDLARFRSRLDEARWAARRADPDREAAALSAALAEWRGDPFVDVPSESLHREAAAVLREQRMQAVEAWFDVELRRGRGVEMVGEMLAETARHPVRERLWMQLMTALHRAGRRADALAVYQALRRNLAEELGVGPGPEIGHLHAAILTGPAGTGPGSDGDHVPVPRHLPPDVPGFTGRAGPVARLDALVDAAGPLGVGPLGAGPLAPGPMVIAVITGTAGVGKTALAAHWARRVADRFPDGQLWANLNGYHPGKATTPEQALTRFLRAFGVPGRRIPVDLDDQTNLYRSLMDGRRMLVVLDNAGSAEQVRPLLPGAPGSLVVVTSRDALSGLVAGEGARPVGLDLFTAAEARKLLASRLGTTRVAADPDAVTKIIARCARLPLALAVVAARAATRSGFPLDRLAGELADADGRLALLATGDPGVDVRAVFSWSYRTLGGPAARLFRLLGLHPGPDFAAPAAASLAGVTPSRVRPMLDELCDAHLLTEHTPGRFTVHDLLRAYATELAGTDETGTERGAAADRMRDHYLYTAHAAAMLIYLQRDPISPAPPAPGVTVAELPDHQRAMAWFTAEHPVLLAVLEQAAAAGSDRHVWQLAWTLVEYFARRGPWRHWADTQQAALDAAIRQADRAEQARAHRGLARVHTRRGAYDEARRHSGTALDLYRELGDDAGQAHTWLGLGWVAERQGDHREALRHTERALELYGIVGHRAGQAAALNSVGWYHSLLGDHRNALAYCRSALELLREVGDRYGLAATWDSLGHAHRHLGDHAAAAASYAHALDLYRDLGDRYNEADTLVGLGDAHESAGHFDAAMAAWREASEILERFGHPDAGAVRERLDHTSTRPR